ncbi:UPF0182 family protein [Candidatus Leptofilum sp.]|uniref:UPF0182 family membrane protein n=1 Tax=Candidatus Leptofilum sp. TaxID=3241576 RepID=UPI003B5A67D3
MSRDNWDIPEVFRRAMEEAGWEGNRGEGGEGGEGGDRPPFPSRPRRPRGSNRNLWIIGIIFLLFISLNWLVGIYTDWLWFTELTYENVWLTRWSYQFFSFVAFFIIAFLILWGNWAIARRRAIKDTPEYNPRFLQIGAVKWILLGLALFLSFGFASSIAVRWDEFLLFLNRVPFGTDDPIFNRDISFYLFELPVYEALQQWLVSLLLLTILGTLAIYAVNNVIEIQRGKWRPWESAVLRQHVAFLAALILLLWASGNLFEIFNLNYSSRGVVFGASYTDINASLYALYGQIAFMVLGALVMLVNIFRLSLRPLLVAGGLWLLTTILVGGVYPSLLQRFEVEPNELVRETPYIQYNIDFTRLGFNLDEIQTRDFAQVDPLNQADINANSDVLNNIRLWDYRPLQATYTQLQALRPYYVFGEIDIDRYEIDGELQQVMLATRELDKSQLPSLAWVNTKLEFTHGYGIVMNPVDRFTADGQPEFFIKNLPPESEIPLEVTRPEIYYGELANDEVFVGSDRDEFSYPSGNENVYSSYQGTGGVPLDSFLKRLAFAFRLGDTNVLLSDEINTQTRIQIHRQIQERIDMITPFLALDSDPYIVLTNDGNLVWIQDAFTYSGRFPYATPDSATNINYIRNAVKITIDAYNGTINYYIADEDDPIIQSYSNAFPGLFKPLSQMPESLLSHLRYPEDLFTIQAEQYLRYHMTDVRVFFNQEDVWQIPQEVFEGNQQPMEPYYVIMPLPGEAESEYLMIQPFNPVGKDNMIAWMAVRNDPENYGELVVYELPKQELVFGPLQVESRIDQEPTISQQFSLWDQGGSNVIRGNLLVIPLNDSFLYVEPVYLRADTSALPELKRVIVATDTRIAMDTSLNGALSALLLESPGDIVVEDEGDGDTAVSTEDSPPVQTAPVDATVEELISAANTHFEAAQAAQRDGDWATYGAELAALEETLNRLVELTGETP